MMHALVTGSTGFVGRHLVRRLLDGGYRVSCLLRPGSHAASLKEFSSPRLHLIRSDFKEPDILAGNLENYSHIFHSAGVITAAKWEDYYRANCQYTAHLLQALTRQTPPPKRFVHISSISASGPSTPGVFKMESDPCEPNSDYGYSKWMAEQIVQDYKNRFPVVILRPPNILGPMQKELLQGIQMVRRGICPLIGNGDIQTSFCFVEDLTEACLAAAEANVSSGRVYFLAHPHPCSWRDITREIKNQLRPGGWSLKIPHFLQVVAAVLSEAAAFFTRKTPALTREQLRLSRRYYWLYSGERIVRELGVRCPTGLSGAIEKTIEFYRSRGIL